MSYVQTRTPELEKAKSKPLSQASVQEIQLELIRRRKFNAFDGERVTDLLLEHRDLWESVMMERLAISNPGKLPALGLLKLRDLPRDQWNVDTLYILTPTEEQAHALAELFRTHEPAAMVDIHNNPNDIDIALGDAEPHHSVVAVWWA